jgi:hypothetical protein
VTKRSAGGDNVWRGRAVTLIACISAMFSFVLPSVPTAQAATTPSIQLLSVSSWGPDPGGHDHIVGELINNSNTVADLVKVAVNYYDISGNVLGTDSTYSTLTTMDPGQASPFEFIFEPPIGYDHFAITSITAEAASQTANTYFAVKVTNMYVDASGTTHYVGTVTNENSTSSSSVLITLTGYNGEGQAVGTDLTHPNTDSSGDMTARETAPFDLTVASYEPTFSNYRVVAESANAPQPTPQHSPLSRIAGNDAIATTIALSQQSFADESARAVTLARSDFFSDGLAGGPLAAKTQGPLLITPGARQSSSLDSRVAAEIQRVLPPGDTVYILGGDLALAPNIDAQLQQMGYKTQRVAGQTAAATAVAIAQQLGNPSTVFEATGTNFPDALSAVPAAIKKNGVILLTDGSSQNPTTSAYLSQHPSDTRYAVGGPLAAAGADPSATPVWGSDLYDTSAVIDARFFPAATVYGAATGANYPDALAGGVFVSDGGRSGPIVLVAPSTPLPPAAYGYLIDTPTITSGYLFGGTLAVNPAVATALSQSPSTTTTTPSPLSLTWRGRTTIDPNRGEPTSVSCPSTTFCVAVDDTGNWLRYNGTSWSAPASFGASSSVSCPSAQFCLALGGGGSFQYNGSSWSATTAAAPYGLDSVSCESSTFCAAVGVRYNPNPQIGGVIDEAAIFDGSSWSPPTTLDSFGIQSTIGVASVACPTVTFCEAVDDGGNAFTYTATGWSAASSDGLGSSFTSMTPVSVSCSSNTNCTAVYGNDAAKFNGSGWSSPVAVDDASGEGLDSVSCTATGFCAAGDAAGRAVTGSGLGWSTPTQVDPNALSTHSSISCA